MKKNVLFWLVLLLSINVAYSHSEESFKEAQELINTKISCDKLTDEKLELMGDYFMEQMHPGESHEMMDKMMGGEGSENLKQMHIQMAKRFYCNEDAGGMMGGNMMNMMMGGNMIGQGGMMNMMGSGGMMGTSMFGWMWFFWLIGTGISIAVLVALILLIIWLYKKIMKEK